MPASATGRRRSQGASIASGHPPSMSGGRREPARHRGRCRTNQPFLRGFSSAVQGRRPDWSPRERGCADCGTAPGWRQDFATVAPLGRVRARATSRWPGPATIIGRRGPALGTVTGRGPGPPRRRRDALRPAGARRGRMIACGDPRRPVLAARGADRAPAGGLGPRRWALRAAVDKELRPPVARGPPRARLAAAAGLDGDGIGFLTAVDVRGGPLGRGGRRGQALATVGLGWPTWAAAPPAVDSALRAVGGRGAEPGTVNLLVWVPARAGRRVRSSTRSPRPPRPRPRPWSSSTSRAPARRPTPSPSAARSTARSSPTAAPDRRGAPAWPAPSTPRSPREPGPKQSPRTAPGAIPPDGLCRRHGVRRLGAAGAPGDGAGHAGDEGFEHRGAGGEVEAHEALALGTEVGPGESTAPPSRRTVCGGSASGRAPHVEPGQVRGVRRDVADVRERRGRGASRGAGGCGRGGRRGRRASPRRPPMPW